MEVPSDSKSLKSVKGLAAQKLIQLRIEILSEWEQQAREQIPEAAELSQPLLIDTVPTFFDNLIEALAEDHSRELATTSNSVAKEHGGERARLSRYGPDQLMKEYRILRQIIFAKLDTLPTFAQRDRDTVLKSFEHAVQEAMMAFFLVHSKIREQFVVGLSHDLRNPLGAAKMAGELILLVASDIQDPAMSEDFKGLAQKVVNNTKRADRLIQDLLDTSALQFGERLPLFFVECDLREVVSDAVLELSENEQQRIQIEGSSIKGFWDRDAMRRAIENLLTNAFKYGSAGTPIKIRMTCVKQRVILSVHNEGKPIPIEDQEILFQPFRRSQLAKTSGQKGWGIGLALVRGVAEGHGGSVGLDSSLDTGTTFFLDFPVDSRPFKGAPTTE